MSETWFWQIARSAWLACPAPAAIGLSFLAYPRVPWLAFSLDGAFVAAMFTLAMYARRRARRMAAA